MATFWFVAFFIPGQRQVAMDGWRRDLDVRAEIRMEALSRFFVDGLADAETLAAYPMVLQILAMRSAGAGRPVGDAGAPAVHLEELFGNFVRIHGVLGVVLWGADGKPCVKSSDLVLDGACLAPAREVLAAGAPAIGLHLHAAFGPILTFSAPVRLANGDVRGALVVAVDPRAWLYPLLAQPLAGTSTGEAFLVGRDGADILFLSPLHNRPSASLSFRRPFAESGLAARAVLEGSETVGPYVDYRGIRVLAGGRRIPPSPWALVVKIDEKEALADFRAGVRRTALVWGSLVVAFLGIAWGALQMHGRKQAAALRDSEERFRLAAESAADVIYEWDIGTKIQWFGSVDELMGYAPGEFPRTLEGWAALVHPEDRERVSAAIGMQLKGEVPYDVEYRVRKKDGTYGHWSARGSVLRDATGKPYRWIGSVTDITERKTAETVLKESEARYRTLLENIPQGIFLKSRTFRYVSVNENYARDLGIRPEEAVGKVDYDLFPKELADKYRADDERVMRTAQSEDFEEQYIRGGSQTWIHTIKTPVRDSDGEIIGVLGVFWDITERKQADEALRESEAKLRGLTEELESRVETRTAELKAANRELEAFSYSVSHDLRAPLRAVDGFSRILLEDHAKQLDAEGRRLLDVVRSNTRQMGQLIDDLLSFSRVGRQQMARTAVDMRALAHAAFRDLAVADERVSFTVGALPPADVDPSLMRQVWTNLISNSLKFTRPKAERAIEVEGRTEPGRVVYSVKDNGAGFDMAYSNKLFGVFQRLHSSAEFEGTGVGLALVQRIVHRHGGEVWAEGKVGEGATFSFSLPRPGGPI